MLKKIYLTSFIFSFSVALTTYVNSSLLEKIFGDFYVGILYIIASLISLILLGLMPKIIAKFGAYKFIITMFIINILASLVLVRSDSAMFSAVGFFLFFPSIPIIYFCFDLFIEHFSKPGATGHSRGLYLFAINSGWLFAPLIVGRLIKSGQFSPVYYLAQTVSFIAFIFVIIFIKKYHDPKYNRQTLHQTLIDLKSKPLLKNAIKLNFLLQFFFAFMVIYSPIYLSSHFNLNWGQMGMIFSVMLSAFILLEYPVGVLTDKKKINNVGTIFFGLCIMVLALTIFYNLKPATPVIIIGLIIFLTRVGAAIYESSVEYFFFSKTDDSNTEIISLFRDMSPLAYVVAPTIGTLVIKAMPLKNIFIILAVFILLAGSIIIKKINNYKKTNEKTI